MQNWKMALGTMALGAVTISPFVAEVAFAGAEKAVKKVKPPEPTAAEIEQGQLLDKGPRWKPSVSAQSPTGGVPTDPTAAEVETGQKLIKDKPISKMSTGGAPTDPTAAEVETGQKLIKDKPISKMSTGGAPTDPTAAEVETGQKLIKDKPVSAAATGNDLCGLPYTPPCRSDASTVKKTPDKVKPGLKGGSVIVALLASAGAIGALVAFSGGNDGPTSP